MTVLAVAAGGGGDAITATVVGRALGHRDVAAVLTYSWDRLLVDPVPGPRTAAEFTGLHAPAPGILEVLPTTAPVAPAGSALPRLAAELPSRVFLLDPTSGAVGMAEQVEAVAGTVGASEVALVDVGGDVLTDGTDSGLRSPLADQLALAASSASGLSIRVVVTGAGLDGELPPATVLGRLRVLGADRLADLTAHDVAPAASVLGWHPSEATGLLHAAATGCRGRVEVRDAGARVELTRTTPQVFAVPAARVLARTPAAQIIGSRSLAEAERIVYAATGVSELRQEAAKARGLSARATTFPGPADLPAVDGHAAAARSRGADFLTMRRLSELLGATTLPAFAALVTLVAEERPDQYRHSLFRTA